MHRSLTSLILTLALIASPAAFAASETTLTTHGAHRHLTNIVFSGLAGAIMGLSTLSFYGRPQDRLNNIAVGFAIGVIGGTIYTTYRAASEPRDFYGLRDRPEPWALYDNPRFARARAIDLAAYQFSF